MAHSPNRYVHDPDCAERVARAAATLNAHMGCAFAQLSPFTGFHWSAIGTDGNAITHSGFGLLGDAIVDECLRRDVPLLDCRSMETDAFMCAVIGGPMLAVGTYIERVPLVGPNGEMPGSLDSLSAPDFARYHVERGAVLHGTPYDLIDPYRAPCIDPALWPDPSRLPSRRLDRAA